ncbi:hypothetical protein BG61_05040 [Caballeronia glathei]|uniref:Uncharacterized protein n=1 Tax=Caballeronia glathei TaxID=60547 RepID=A0A069PQM7_9BURK|nr:hypothetical protein BG61_05040 [Caballeronia glathei]
MCHDVSTENAVHAALAGMLRTRRRADAVRPQSRANMGESARRAPFHPFDTPPRQTFTHACHDAGTVPAVHGTARVRRRAGGPPMYRQKTPFA